MDAASDLKNQVDDLMDDPTNSNEYEAQKGKYMTFKSGNEFFGLKIQYVSEIIQFQAITEIPETEKYIKGLINLRGKMIPVIDVRLRFGQQPFEYNDRTCIIVINVQSMVVGLIVEKIAEAVDIRDQDILPPPAIGRADKAHHKYVYGIAKVGDAVKLLLDPDKLLNGSDVATAEKVNETSVDEEREVSK